MKYPHLAARIFNTPLLIHPQKLDAIIAGLGPRLLDTHLTNTVGAPGVDLNVMPVELFSTRRGERAEAGYQVVDGVAVISVNGALVHRGRMQGASTYLLGYNDLASAVEDAMSNPDVHAVLKVYDSPGGEAQGAFEYAQRMMALRGKKPMKAIADGMAASAGYLGASAADEFAITRTGYAGSIGVVMRHVDFSRAMANDGITVTHIYAGAHKVDGHPYAPLPDAVRDDLQAEVNDLYGMFIEAVVAHRGMTAEAVRKTEAATYRGVAAVAAGLADRLGTTDQMISELAALRVRSYPVGQPARATAHDKGDTHMSGTQAPAGNTPAPAALTQADVDRARTEGVEAGAQAERARVGAILGHEAAACSPLALQCINTGLTAEQSTAILGAAPKAPAAEAQPGNAFAAAMTNVGNPDVRPGAGAVTEQDDPKLISASWDRAFNVTGNA
jgi:signal peptide peptidase SppA